MREVFTMWRETRMIVLVAVVAAIYAAVLIPFKTLTILPGLTSIRPANVFPVVFGIIFGPAAAWGAAIGNLIGDIFGGTFGPGSLGGFVGNFFFGFVGYKLWGNLGLLSSDTEPNFRSNAGRQLVEYVIVAVAASAACAAIISWWADLLELVPFTVLAPIILVNNTLAAVILGPPLLYLTYPRIKEMGLLYPDLLRAEDISVASRARRQLAAYGLFVVPVVWIGVGLTLGVASGTTNLAVVGGIGLLLVFAFAIIGGERLSALLRDTPAA
jgi:energy-coupling factor transport system substrate-specific component